MFPGIGRLVGRNVRVIHQGTLAVDGWLVTFGTLKRGMNVWTPHQ